MQDSEAPHMAQQHTPFGDAVLLGREASISIPQRGSPTPPPALPGDDSEAADQDGSGAGPDRPHSRASVACGTRKA